MLLEIAPELLAMGLSVAALTVHGVDNSRTSSELIAYRRQQAQRLATYWKNRSITSHPAVCEYHRIHDLVGAHGQTPAPEKLITYVRRQRDLTATGPIIDCYNLVLRTLLSIGAHDIARLASPVTLRYATAGDIFVPLGQTEEQRFPGEYAYIDPRNRIICRLDVLQCEHSKVASESRDILCFLQGNRCLPASILLKAAWLLAEMIETFCGGHAELVAFHDADSVELPTVGKLTISLESFKQLNLQVGTVLQVERHSDLPPYLVSA
jgi:DNA/RNA-binding domain of Phe-tRNA-synthetase-like protein